MAPTGVSVKQSRKSALLMLAPASLTLVCFLALPLATLLRYSFNRFSPQQLMTEAFTAENYVKFLAEPFFRDVLATTFAIAAGCTS